MKKITTWLVADCGKIPSKSHCHVVTMAPEDQRKDFIDAVAAHAVTKHGDLDTPELRTELTETLERVEP
ncbi:MAG: DUF1059 domain-containing protein [bacterium]|nr:DUF1059 domain-containing protein [bacterium]